MRILIFQKFRLRQDSQLGCFGRDFAEISAIFSRDRGLCRTLDIYIFLHLYLTLFIWMDFTLHIDSISMDLSILYFKGLSNNSADPDEMAHYVAFHMGLHCLPKYLYTGKVKFIFKRFHRASQIFLA